MVIETLSYHTGRDSKHLLKPLCGQWTCLFPSAENGTRTLCMLDKHSITEAYSQPVFLEYRCSRPWLGDILGISFAISCVSLLHSAGLQAV